jgi:hypothetical protein
MPRRRLLSGQQLVLEIKRLNKNKQQQTSAKNHYHRPETYPDKPNYDPDYCDYFQQVKQYVHQRHNSEHSSGLSNDTNSLFPHNVCQDLEDCGYQVWEMPRLTRGPRAPNASRLYFPLHPPGAIKIGGCGGGFWVSLSRTDTR